MLEHRSSRTDAGKHTHVEFPMIDPVTTTKDVPSLVMLVEAIRNLHLCSCGTWELRHDVDRLIRLGHLMLANWNQHLAKEAPQAEVRSQDEGTVKNEWLAEWRKSAAACAGTGRVAQRICLESHQLGT